MQVLVGLNEKNQGFILTTEIAHFIYKTPSHKNIKNYVEQIIESREKKEEFNVGSSDQINRKINDILGFLSLSNYILLDKRGKYSLNLNMLDEAKNCIEIVVKKYRLG